MAKILITDGMDQEKAQELKDMGHTLIEEKVSPEELLERIKEVDAVIIRSRTKITKEVVDAAVAGGQLKVAIRAGIGLDNIDVAYATEKGIAVYNTPNSSANSVAELALAQMINIARHIPLANAEMEDGAWNKSKYSGVEIMGKTLGLIGYGRIAKSLADKAEALGMKVVFTDIGEVEPNGRQKVTMDELFEQADFISLHIPGGQGNYHLIDDEQFNKMKDCVYLVDLARGGVVSEEALLRALNSGKVKAAALDVFEEEPTKNMELVCHPNVAVTPHIGAATAEAQKRIGEEIVQIIRENF